MRAGRLRNVVNVTEPPHYTALATTWAAIEPQLSMGNENKTSLLDDLQVVIRTRFDSGLTLRPGMRLSHGARLFEILNVVDDTRRSEIIINAREWIGAADATFTPAGSGTPETARAWRYVRYYYENEFAETGERETVIVFLQSELYAKPQKGDRITFYGTNYTVIGLAEDGDDGIEYRVRVR